MSLNFATAISLSLEGEAAERVRAFEPSVIALVDRRGRRQLVPLNGRLARDWLPSRNLFQTALMPDPDFVCGTIH